MKLLKVAFTGLPLFHEKVEIEFAATQRVNADNAEKMSLLFEEQGKKRYANNVLSFIGINASGKTTVLKALSFAFALLNNEPIHSTPYPELFSGLSSDKTVQFDFCFLSHSSLYYLHTEILKKEKLVITNETLKEKPLSKIKKKTDLWEEDNASIVLERKKDEAYLLDDVSIMVAFNKKQHEEICYQDLLQFTNVNRLSLDEDCPPELLTFFDPSVEYLRTIPTDKGPAGILKFYDKSEIHLDRLADADHYLSSGTIKGIRLFLASIQAFKTGGYLLLDELENHFNHEIVSTLIRFYMDPKVNQAGATLIYSTHYAEILDEFERNDNIYLVRNRNGVTVENLSNLLKRNDIKKSDAYQSGYLEGTVPLYDAYMALKKSLLR